DAAGGRARYAYCGNRRNRESSRDRCARRRYLPHQRPGCRRTRDCRRRVCGPGAPGRRRTADPVRRKRMTGPMMERLERVERWPIVGLAGARGVVGGVFLSILVDAGLPAERLRAFGTEVGTAAYGEGSVPVRLL